MATPLVRIKAVLDALKDGDTSNEMIGRVLSACTFRQFPGVDLDLYTPSQKAAASLNLLRAHLTTLVRQYEMHAVIQAAKEASGGEPVDIGSKEPV